MAGSIDRLDCVQASIHFLSHSFVSEMDARLCTEISSIIEFGNKLMSFDKLCGFREARRSRDRMVHDLVHVDNVGLVC